VWDAQRPRLGKRLQQRRNSNIVAKRLADVREPVYISRPKHKASAQLKWILPQLVLMMAGGSSALSCHGVLAAEEMQKVRGLQFHRAISLARFVNQKRKGDACFFAKHSRVIAVAQSNRSTRGSFVLERSFVFAQLRDVLSAKDSAVVAEKNQHGRLSGPQRAKTNLPPVAIGKGNCCEPAA
jgi:hypothetical protein